MGWFDMIRRLERKVVNGRYLSFLQCLEKKMAEAGGYDLNDPFIDDGNLNNEETYINVLSAWFMERRYLNRLLSK